MKNTLITEIVNFNVLETTTDEQLLLKADGFIGDFLKKQDGFVDAELIKTTESNARNFIIRYENMEKVRTIIEKLRESQEFNEFKSIVVPGSISVTFQPQVKTW